MKQCKTPASTPEAVLTNLREAEAKIQSALSEHGDPSDLLLSFDSVWAFQDWYADKMQLDLDDVAPGAKHVHELVFGLVYTGLLARNLNMELPSVQPAVPTRTTFMVAMSVEDFRALSDAESILEDGPLANSMIDSQIEKLNPRAEVEYDAQLGPNIFYTLDAEDATTIAHQQIQSIVQCQIMKARAWIAAGRPTAD